jgi:hypothetical protein
MGLLFKGKFQGLDGLLKHKRGLYTESIDSLSMIEGIDKFGDNKFLMELLKIFKSLMGL